MQEIELKLQIKEPKQWDEVCYFVEQLDRCCSVRKNIQMTAHYFDTAEGDLRKAKMAYRVRRENENLVATLKGGGVVRDGLHQRSEWNVEVSHAKPDLGVFLHNDVDEMLLRGLSDKIFIEIVRTEFLRRSVEVQWNDSVIEIALDKGWIFSGDSKAPILEIELELKDGKVEDVIALGDFFATRFNVMKEGKSKFLRGVLLNQTSV